MKRFIIGKIRVVTKMEDIVLKYDGLLTICTGSSRMTKIWKQKKLAWSDFLKKLSVTKRTNETQAEFFRLGKPRQDEIKDVGGFVGGTLENGLRISTSKVERQLITLDADFAEKNLWEKVTAVFDNAICAYSTHKHKPDSPRLRLIIPLNRFVSADEYQAISRKVAEHFGIDNFDDTTYQAQRLMYWPSTSSDAEYFFRYQDGEWLSADKVLDEYDDWQDQSKWATSSRMTETVRLAMKKAEDPLAKKGIIGTFCRAYSIPEVITEFLADTYELFGEDRYTFTGGSTAGGALVYEDKWLYSYHNSDPCSLQLCNAFDLIRIHKYGAQDEGKIYEDITKAPSYKSMLEFCSKDEKTKILMAEEERKEVQAIFDILGDYDDDCSWTAKLKRASKSGKILTTRNNIRVILENDPKIQGCFGYDLFAQRISIIKPVFWRKDREENPYWCDDDDAQIRHYFETAYDIESTKKIDDEIISVAYKNSFHRVREYLRKLKWDGIERLDTFFIDYLGAIDSLYVRSVTRKCLLAAVGRVMQPGLKFDNMLVLEGAQGIGKSELLSRLGKKWFSDSLSEMQGKEAYEALRGYWIIEISELEAMKRSDVSAVKKFLSKKVDSFREAYGRRTQDYPRQCVFFGTTNEKIFLKDATGNRRFFPVSVGLVKPTKAIFNNPELDSDIDQVWAEALVAWDNGETTWIGSEMELIAKKVQAQHTEEMPLLGMIENYLERRIPLDWYKWGLSRRLEFLRNNDFDALDESESMKRNKTCTAEIWCEVLNGDLKKLNPYETGKITTLLNSLEDWMPYENSGEKMDFGDSYGLQKAYVRRNEAEQSKIEEKEDEDFDF